MMMGSGFMTPERRQMMAQALSQGGGAGAGGDQWGGMRSGIADMRARYAPQQVSPGTHANGGWQTSMENSGNGPLSQLFGMPQGGMMSFLSRFLNRGQGGAPAAPVAAQEPYMRDMANARARQMAQAMATGPAGAPAAAPVGVDQGGIGSLLARLGVGA